MSPELILLLMVASFFFLLAIGVPLAWSMFGIGLLFGFIEFGPAVFSLTLARFGDITGSFSLIAIPLFVFMANMLSVSGIAGELFEAVHRWMGGIRGGPAMASVVTCTVLAAMVGTGGAGIVIMGLIALPAMMALGYNKHMAMGSIVAGGSLGLMIPPSVMFILYGMFSGQSIGALFIGGIGPGLLLAALYILYIGVRSYLQPSLAPIPGEPIPVAAGAGGSSGTGSAGGGSASADDGADTHAVVEGYDDSFWDKVKLLKSLALPIALVLVVLGSIYFGIASVGEASGIGAAGAIVAAAVRGRLNLTTLKQALYGTMRTVGVVMWITLGAVTFVGVITRVGGGRVIEGWLADLPFGPWGVLITIMLILLLLGMVIDVIGLVVLTVPIFAPIVAGLGFDPLWFGILFNMNLQLAFLSPPFGYGMFYLKSVAPSDVTTADLYRSVFPFLLLQLLALAIVMAFPDIVRWLPAQMG